MKVLKFGGTSVGTVDSLRNVKSIVEATERPAIVVVSALGGVTDMLIATANLAAGGDLSAYLERFATIRLRHRTVIDGIVRPDEQKRVAAEVERLMLELERLYYGIYLVGDLSERVLNRVVSYGERMSSVIVSGIVEGITLHNSLDFIRTTRSHGRNILDGPETARLIDTFLPDAAAPDALTLVQGFISTDADGEITNLGRGGSDYTAAILAAHFSADILEIWTDVDGFLTADPRKIPAARIIDRMSFVEAMDLCNFGAKVVYPPTIYPVFHKSIPIMIKNTFNPSAPGTCIGENAPDAGHARGISSLPDTCLITIATDGADSDHVKNRVLNAMARKGIDIFMVDTAAEGNPIAFTVRNAEADTVSDELRLEFAPEEAAGTVAVGNPLHNLCSLAAVGEGLADPERLTERIEEILSQAGIATLARAVAGSGSNVAVVVSRDAETDALRLIHNELFPDKQ